MKTPSLEELLVGPQQIELETPSGKLKLYVRRLNSIERDMCTASARRASKEMRKQLMDRESEAYNLLVKDEVEEYSIDNLRQAWVNSRLSKKSIQIYRASLESRDETFIPEPEGDDVTAAEIEEWELKTENIEELREANVAQAIKSANMQLMEEAKELSEEDLLEQAIPVIIDTICQDIWTTEYVSQLIARGTYKDKDATKPAFTSSNEVKRLGADALRVLSRSHMALLVEPEAVKN